jgi:hypothetical protein
VIEAVDEGLDGAFEIGEVHDPAQLRVERAAHRDLAAERVAVNAPALVSLRHVRQPVRRFEAEVLHQLDDIAHAPQSSATVASEGSRDDVISASARTTSTR